MAGVESVGRRGVRTCMCVRPVAHLFVQTVLPLNQFALMN